MGKEEEVRTRKAKEPETQRSEMVLKPEMLCCHSAHGGHTHSHVICQRLIFLATWPQGQHVNQPQSLEAMTSQSWVAMGGASLAAECSLWEVSSSHVPRAHRRYKHLTSPLHTGVCAKEHCLFSSASSPVKHKQVYTST